MKKLLTLFTALVWLGCMSFVQADTWTVAGSNTALLGTSWDVSNTANDMINVKSNEWYLLKVKTFSTADNAFKYKVAKNHKWDEAYPGSDKSYSLTSGTYDVLFKFNSNTKAVSEERLTSWTVAGTADVFGNGWSTTDTNNDMARSGNNWTLTKNHILLAVGTTYECKVVANHAWTYAFPSDNKEFTVAEDGYYDVTIDFNTSTLAVTVTTTFLEPAVPPTPTITLHSNISGSWATSDAFAIASGDETASLEIKNVAVGSYELGVKINDNWTSNGTAFTRANNSHAVVTGSGNCTFVADIVGDYTFTWTYESNTLQITYPDMTTKKVKFFAPRTEDNPWAQVYAYAWNGDVTYSAWPGVEITATKDAGWYSYDVPVGASVLFHDNAAARMQTNDITNVQADVCYVPTEINYDVTPKKVSVAVDADCKMEYYIAGSKALIGGTSDFGTFLPLDENNQIKFEDVAAGEYAFKLNINNWAWALGGNQHLSDEEGCGTIAKEVGTGDVGFAIDHTQDVTITYYPSTQKICLGAETTKSAASVTVEDMSVYAGKARSIKATKETDAEQIEYEILSGGEYINIADGKITGVAAGTATVRASVAETATYLDASDEFTVTVSALQTAKVKFFAPRTEDNPWAQVYAYAWIDGDPQSAAWPGDEITETKNAGWYEYDVPVGASVVFTDYNTPKGLMKTADIENVTEAKSFVPTSIYYPETPGEDKIASIIEQDAVAYYIAGSKALLGGESDFGTFLALDGNNQIVFHDVEPGTYAFKINIGNWAWALGGIDNMKEGDCASIATTVGTGDLGFVIDTKQDVTVTYYPETQEICLGAVTVKATTTISIDAVAIEAGESKKITYWTNNTENPNVAYIVESGSEYIKLFKGVITGIKHGEATVHISLSETDNYTAASQEFTVTVSTPAAPATAIEEIGGKFIINAKGDTAVFSRGNLQYQQSSDTWIAAPNQYDWKGTANLQMGNTEYEGWVDLFCWSIGAENNYGATSAYNSTLYENKEFVDWGSKFAGNWSTLSINEWYYMLYTRPNANDLWGVAMIGDTLGMVLLPDQWAAPSGVTFVPGTTPTTKLWDDADCLDPTMANQDHWRVHKENMPANKFTLEEWAILEAAGAVFCPYGGRRSGGYGNHTNRDNETVDYEYAYTYYENYHGAYWTSTVRYADQGKAYWLPTLCNGCINENENWGRGAHGWWENGRYGYSVRLVHIIPRQYTVTYDANGATGVVVDDNTYPDGAGVTLANADALHKEGFEFAGWKYKGTTYNAGETYTIANVLANEEIVFEAQWEPVWTIVRTELAPNAYYTMCLDKAVTDVRGASLWKVVSKAENGKDIILEEVTATEAGRPYIFYATAENLEVLYTGNPVNGPVNDEENHGLVGSFNKAQIAANESNYIIYNNELYLVNSDNVYVGANRAYLRMAAVPEFESGNAPAPGRRRVSMAVHGEQVATGVESIQPSEISIQKVLINGELYILRGEKMYDVTGKVVKGE